MSAVDHPAHYGGDTAYESIKVIEAWGLGFSLGNAVKYISRAGKKDPAAEVEDLRKAAWYLNRRIEELTAPAKYVIQVGSGGAASTNSSGAVSGARSGT